MVMLKKLINSNSLQFIGEKLAREASDRGIPVTTIRFPAVLGDSETGYMPNSYCLFWNTLLASIHLKMVPDLLFNVPVMDVNSAAKVAAHLFLTDLWTWTMKKL